MNYENNNLLLYKTAADGDYGRVKNVLLSDDCDVNFQNEDRNGNTPLYIAASWGKSHLAVIDLLLEYGADINLTNNASQTPLYVAASWGHLDVVNVLIKNDADLDTKNYGGRTALHIAACRKPHDGNKFKAYHVNGLLTIIESAIINMGNILKKYVEYLPNLEDDYIKLCKFYFKSYISDEAAELAIFYSHFGVVAALVEAGANINAKDYLGETPLRKAARAEHCPMARFLLDHGGEL